MRKSLFWTADRWEVLSSVCPIWEHGCDQKSKGRLTRGTRCRKASPTGARGVLLGVALLALPVGYALAALGCLAGVDA